MAKWWLLVCLALGSVGVVRAAPPEAAAFEEFPVTPALVRELRLGGFVLYVRHGITDNRKADRLPSVDLNDCGTQRQLSDEGRELMKRVGQGMRRAGIPIGQVLASPMCRTRESAQLAFGDRVELVESLMYSSTMTTQEKKPRIEALKGLLRSPPPKGSNTVLVAHAPNLADLIGFFVKPEGTVVVFRPTGPQGFEYQASIHPADWARLR